MIANQGLVHFRGNVMLQSPRSSHFEAFIGRIYPYVGHEVENETFISNISHEKNVWPHYAAQIRLAAFYASHRSPSACRKPAPGLSQ